MSNYLEERRKLKLGIISKPEKTKKPIAKKSAKRAKEEKQYAPVRKKFLQDHPLCEIKLPGCLIKSTEVHHASGRTNGNLLRVEDFVASCSNCHRQGHDKLSSEDAKKIGFKKTKKNG